MRLVRVDPKLHRTRFTKPAHCIGETVRPWADHHGLGWGRRFDHVRFRAAIYNSTSCFTMGAGPFQNGVFANGLELILDQGQAPATHGVIAPVQVVQLAEYQTDLANTRTAWQIDET